MKKSIFILLNACLVLFLADACFSLLGNVLILLTGSHLLDPVVGLVTVISTLLCILIYLLIGLTPMVPKRFFLPLTLFYPLLLMGLLPMTIFHMDRLVWIDTAGALLQLLFGLFLLYRIQGGFRWRPPLLPLALVGDRRFSLGNLAAFVALNLFLLIPGSAFYLGWCGSKAVDHFSDGFLALHHNRFSVRAREYARSDGKTIHLVPMMHVGETDFYRQIVQSIPTNSAVLLEGVSDEKNLLGRKLSYKKMASSLGLSEQHENFEPEQGKLINADIDISEFSKRSLGFLKLVTRIHSEGLTPALIQQAMEQSKDPELMKELWADLLTRRNAHLLEEIKGELEESEVIVVPWGAAHMPELAAEIKEMGFAQKREREFTIFHYRTVWQGKSNKPEIRSK